MDISFSGAGFMGCYYFGVVDCLNRYVPRERINRVAGASAGSLIAAYYLMDLPLVPCLRAIIDMTVDIRRRPLGVFDRSNQIVDILPKMLDKLFPEDAHKIVSGRLFVGMTRLKDMKKVMVSEFESRQELIDALNCSCFIPVWSGNHVSTYKGVKHIDGGFTDNLPVFDEHTIKVCCFAGPSDIAPYDRKRLVKLSANFLNTPLHFSMANMKRGRTALFPPAPKVIVELLERGFHDAKQFILNNDVIQCNECYNSLRPEEQSFANIQVPVITPSGSPSASEDPDYRKPAFPRRASSPSIVTENGLLSAINASLIAHQRHQQDSDSGIQSQLDDQLADFNNNNKQPVSIVIEAPADNPEPDQAKANKRNFKALRLNMSALNKQKTIKSEQEDDIIGEEEDAELARKYNNKCGGRRPTLPANVPSQKFLERRRNTVQAEGPLLPVPERFAFTQMQLPSCPPSPNLDRHCTECLLMRQAARVDHLEEEVRAEAAQFVEGDQSNSTNSSQDSEDSIKQDQDSTDQQASGGKTKRKLTRSLTSPLRWIRQIGTKSTNSYDFEGGEPPSGLHDQEPLKC